MSSRAADLPISLSAENKVSATSDSIPVEVVNMHRDERDIRLLLSLGLTCILTLVLLVLSFSANVWMYFRRPDRIVVDRRADGDHVVAINGREIKLGLSVGPDVPGMDDKRRLANEWASLRFSVDPVTRKTAIEKLFMTMHPAMSTRYLQILKGKNVLERERAEQTRSVWKPQMVVVDSQDKYRINITGVQEIDKVFNGVPVRETVQHMFGLRLMLDKEGGRADHNLRTGFLVFDIVDPKETVISTNDGSVANNPSKQQ